MSENATPKEMLEFARIIGDMGELPHPIHPVVQSRIVWEDYGDSGILGSFTWWKGVNVVRLSDTLRMSLDMAVPTLCHELRHVYQYDAMGTILYMLASIPVLRRFTLEKSAWKVERAAEDNLGMTGFNGDSIPWF